MKVAIFGHEGQLARAMRVSVPQDVEIVAADRATVELNDMAAIERFVTEVRPQVVINTAAFTDVDLAESRQDEAYAVNALAVGTMANACANVSARLLHVSTDFVFDGLRSTPYTPREAPAPLNVYGASKLEGERRIQNVAELDWAIVRTSWLYSPMRRNFVLTIIRLLRERETLDVVADQTGSPTSVRSLARMLWKLVNAPNVDGILHYADAGAASRYDLAVAIHEEASARGLVPSDRRVLPASSAQYPLPAKRPAYSVLDSSAALRALDIEPIHWRVALRQVLEELRS